MATATLIALGLIILATGCGSESNSRIPGVDTAVSNTVELSATEINTTDFPALALEQVFSELPFVGPVAMLQAPGDDTRWFVVQRGGAVLMFPNDNAVTQSSEFININTAIDSSGEGGLLGMAFHPDFPNRPEVFLSYTRTGPDAQRLPLTSVISRFTLNDDGLSINPASEEEILTLDQPFTNHNGGNIGFGPDGFLYIGLGDGGSGNDPLNSGQDINTLLGAMLRIDVDAPPAEGKNYAIPSDNPFAAGGGAPEIFAWGLRNPWRWSFDRDTGQLWLGDVGQGVWEEVDIIERGKNYGWNPCEGTHVRGTTIPCSVSGFTNPIAEYHHILGCSVTGGYVYRGASIANLNGVYFFGDVCTGRIAALRQAPAGTAQVGVVINTMLTVVSYAQSLDGEIFVVNLGGTLHKIVAAP